MKNKKITSHVTGLDALTDNLVIECDDRDPDAGNGSHHYTIKDQAALSVFATIDFQHGPRGESASRPGITSQALLALLIDHLQGFQEGPFKSRENALAITALEEARNWLLQRVIDRKRHDVLGKKREVRPPEKK